MYVCMYVSVHIYLSIYLYAGMYASIYVYNIRMRVCERVYKQGVRWVNRHPFEVLILHMHFICFWFCLLCIKLKSQLGTVCVKSSTMTQFTPPEIWKQQTVQLDIQSEAQIRRFQRFWLSMWRFASKPNIKFISYSTRRPASSACKT